METQVLFQVLACVTLVNIALAKAGHKKPRIGVDSKHYKATWHKGSVFI